MWMYSQTNELYHYGILGMKWGVRRSFNRIHENVRANKAARLDAKEKKRKTSLIETQERKKAIIDSNRREAAERIKYYGGKTVAKYAIKDEAAYNKRVAIGKSAVGGLLGASASALAVGFSGGSLLIAAIPAGVVATGAAAVAAIKVGNINSHAKRQIAYTQDSDYGQDVVVKNSRG